MKSFSIVPDEASLASLQRDLRFYPVQNSDPQSLSPQQIKHYNSEGYIAPLDVYAESEIKPLQTYFDALLDSVIAAGGNSYSISSAHLRYGKVWDILNNPTIVRLVSDLLGPNVIGWGSHFFCKMPHDGKAVAWHQDASYWPLSPSKVVTVWLAIDDVDRENACMKFVAGSQNSGHLTYRTSTNDDHNVLSQSIDNAEQYGEVVFDELRAGQVSIHNDLLLHGSEANDSDRRRCGLTLRYCAAEVRAAMGWNEKGVYVLGGDETGHWSNNARPENDYS